MKGYSDVVDSYGGDDHPHIESQIEGTVESVALTTCVTIRNSQIRYPTLWGRRRNS